MKRLVAAPNLALATLWADQLCGAGMDATVQRAWAGSIAGEIPVDQALPEVWVMDESRHAEALQPAARAAQSAVAALGLPRLRRAGGRPLRTVLELRQRTQPMIVSPRLVDGAGRHRGVVAALMPAGTEQARLAQRSGFMAAPAAASTSVRAPRRPATPSGRGQRPAATRLQALRVRCIGDGPPVDRQQHVVAPQAGCFGQAAAGHLGDEHGAALTQAKGLGSATLRPRKPTPNRAGRSLPPPRPGVLQDSEI